MTTILLHLIATSAFALTTANANAPMTPPATCCTRITSTGLPSDSSHPAPRAPLGPRRPPDGTTRYAILMRGASDTAFHAVATMVVQQTTLPVDGQLVIRRVATYSYPNHGQVVDTTMSLVGSLAPILERTYKPSDRVVFYDFAGQLVTGRMGPIASPKAIRDTLPEPAFNSTDTELVIESLALRDGLHATLPIYDPELGGFRHATLEVTGTERTATPRGPREAWVIHERDNALDFQYRIDRATRVMLSKDITNTATGRLVRLRLLD